MTVCVGKFANICRISHPFTRKFILKYYCCITSIHILQIQGVPDGHLTPLNSIYTTIYENEKSYTLWILTAEQKHARRPWILNATRRAYVCGNVYVFIVSLQGQDLHSVYVCMYVGRDRVSLNRRGLVCALLCCGGCFARSESPFTCLRAATNESFFLCRGLSVLCFGAPPSWG